jgi:hypothetical protein
MALPALGDRAALRRSRRKDPCDKLNRREHDSLDAVCQLRVGASEGHLYGKRTQYELTVREAEFQGHPPRTGGG